MEDFKDEQEELSDEDLKKMLQEDTIFYSSLGKDFSKTGKVSFLLPDRVGKFRISVVGVTPEGKYGMHTSFVQIQKPFNAVMEYPDYIRQSDVIRLSLILQNNTAQSKTVSIKEFDRMFTLQPNSSKTIPMRMTTETMPFKFVASDGDSSVPIVVNPTVMNGFLFEKAKTYILKKEDGMVLKNDLTLEVPVNTINDLVQVEVSYTPFNEKVFLTGLDKLVREPHGCFEQTSSATFPMVMLLQYLKELGEENDKTAKMKLDIEKKLRKGVKRLLSFETSTGGFEWFGKSPGHATLTAYGIWQFVEMNTLGDYVDKEVIDRSLNWLKDQFNQADQQFEFGNGLDSFARPPQTVSDVYILFVMSLLETYAIDYSKLLDPVLKKYTQDAFKENDSYLLAFVGLAYQNQNKNDQANSVIAKLLKNQEESGEFSSMETSITRSRGKNLRVETTAAALILLQKTDFTRYSSQIAKGIEFLQQNMQDGYFGSTQTTVLALKALSENSKNVNDSKRDQMHFDVDVAGNNQKFTVHKDQDDSVEFALGSESPIEVEIESRDDMQEGEKHVFSVKYSFRLPNLIDSQNSPLSLEASKLRGNSLLKLNVRVENTGAEEQGMVIVVVHKPSYSKVNLNDLELMRTTGVVDFYELRHQNSEMVFYWRGMEKGGSVGFELDLLDKFGHVKACLLYTSPSPRDLSTSRMPSSA